MITKRKMAVIEDYGKMKIVECDLPPMRSKDLLIKIDACNLCTSEYGIYSGVRKAGFPYAFGHEWVGTVVETGDEVTRFKKGDRVVGCYEYDAESLPAQLADSSTAPRKYSFTEMNEDGFYGRFRACADYLVQPEVCTFTMNKDLDISEAAFLEPLATVCCGIKRLQLKPTDKVLVIGAGTMGILNALVAKAYGSTVFQSEMMPKKIEAARQLGIDCIDVDGKDPIEEIPKVSGIQGFDVVIVAVGVSFAYDQAFKLLKQHEGKVLFFAAGFPEPKMSISPNEIHYRKLEIIGTYTANFADFMEASELLSTCKINVSALVEARYPFEKIDEAMKKANEPGTFRVSVVM